LFYKDIEESVLKEEVGDFHVKAGKITFKGMNAADSQKSS